MGVVLRKRRDRPDEEWWLFINHNNERVSMKAGRNENDARDLQAALELVLGLDKTMNLNKRDRKPADSDAVRRVKNLRVWIARVLEHVDWLLEENRRSRGRQ